MFLSSEGYCCEQAWQIPLLAISIVLYPTQPFYCLPPGSGQDYRTKTLAQGVYTCRGSSCSLSHTYSMITYIPYKVKPLFHVIEADPGMNIAGGSK